MARHAYDMLAIDLDGTLLDPAGEVSARNIEAVRRARRSGMLVSLCTGRGWVECRHIARAVEQVEPVIVAGGSLVACGMTGGTLRRFAMSEPLVRRLVSVVVAHGHAALVLKDSQTTGHDYVVVSPDGRDGIDPITRWWFDAHSVPVRYVRTLDEDSHPDHTVRVGVCGTRRGTAAVAEEILREFHGEVTHHHFPAVAPARSADPESTIVILEVFDRAVSKWGGIEWVSSGKDIEPSRVAAIGNDVNDVAMLRRAGLAVAMGNAVPEARDAARHHTLDNASDGVAHAIDRILAGEW